MVKRPLLLVVGGVAVVLAILRRRRTAGDASVWREATSDTSR